MDVIDNEDEQVTIYIDEDGWVCSFGEQFRKDYATKTQLKITMQDASKLYACEIYHAWRYVDGDFTVQKYSEKQWTQEERLQERTNLHIKTDNDYAKYARQVRLNVDMPHSQEVLDYIDQYNLEVSETVNQPNFPQEVVYPEYHLP